MEFVYVPDPESAKFNDRQDLFPIGHGCHYVKAHGPHVWQHPDVKNDLSCKGHNRCGDHRLVHLDISFLAYCSLDTGHDSLHRDEISGDWPDEASGNVASQPPS